MNLVREPMEMFRCAVQIRGGAECCRRVADNVPRERRQKRVKESYLLLKDMAYHDPHARIALWPAADALGELLDANEHDPDRMAHRGVPSCGLRVLHHEISVHPSRYDTTPRARGVPTSRPSPAGCQTDSWAKKGCAMPALPDRLPLLPPVTK